MGIFNNKHKIISFIALIAITCFLTGTLISNYLKKKKLSLNKDSKNCIKNNPLINIVKSQSGDKLVQSNIGTKIPLIEEPKVALNEETVTQPKDNSEISKDKPNIQSYAFPLSKLPMDLLEGNIFSHLGIKEWNNLSLTDKNLEALSNNPKALASIMNNSKLKIPLEKYIMLAQKAGPYLTKLNLNLLSKYHESADKVSPSELIKDEDLQKIFKACPNIRHFSLLEMARKMTNLTFSDETIAILPKGLKTLEVHDCDKMTAAAFANLPEGLEGLSLHSQLDETAFANLPKKLRLLDLHRCPNVTKLTIDNLPKELEELWLGNDQLKDEDFVNLPKSLKTLDLDGCLNITDAAISNLPEELENLRLNQCPELTVAMIDHLPKGLKSITLPSQFYFLTKHELTGVMNSLKLKGIDVVYDD